MIKQPESFRKVVSFDESLHVWLPIPFPDYLCLGCIVTVGSSPPKTSDVFCLHKSLSVPSHGRECFDLGQEESQTCSVTNVDNQFGTFVVSKRNEQEPLFLDAIIPSVCISNDDNDDACGDLGKLQQEAYVERIAKHSLQQGSYKFLAYTVQFERIWGKGNHDDSFSIWKPVTPSECYSLGDICVGGPAPPGKSLCLHASAGSLISKPSHFVLLWRDSYGSRTLSIWEPVPYSGYVSLGHILEWGSEPPNRGSVVCVHKSIVVAASSGKAFGFSPSRQSTFIFPSSPLRTFVASGVHDGFPFFPTKDICCKRGA